jgi:hypothetical protein
VAKVQIQKQEQRKNVCARFLPLPPFYPLKREGGYTVHGSRFTVYGTRFTVFGSSHSAHWPHSKFDHINNMEFFLDILKLTIPALIVGATAYFLLKALLDERQRIDHALLRNDAQKITLPLRLSAYERLMLLCDRADVANTMLRVRMPDMKVRELRGVLLMAINQEFEHNVSQQLYVSDTLWQIIRIAKNNTLALVTMTGQDLDPNADAEVLVNALLAALDEQSITPLQTAILAVRTEAGQLF